MKKKVLTFAMSLALCVCFLMAAMPEGMKAAEDAGSEICPKATYTLIFHYSDEEEDEVYETAEFELNQKDEEGNWCRDFSCNVTSMKELHSSEYGDYIYTHNGKLYTAGDAYNIENGYSGETVYGDVTYEVYWNRDTSVDGTYMGIMNETQKGSLWVSNPVSFDSLTEAQKETVKPLYDALGAVNLSGAEDAVKTEEMQICGTFMSDMMGREICLWSFFTFGRITTYKGKLGYIYMNGIFTHIPDYIVLQLKEDGTWKDVEADWVQGFPDITFSLQTNEPVLVCTVVDETNIRNDPTCINQIYYNTGSDTPETDNPPADMPETDNPPADVPSTGATAVVDGQTLSVTVNETGANATDVQKTEMDAFMQELGSMEGLTEEEKNKKEEEAYNSLFQNKGGLNVTVKGAHGSMDLSLPGVTFPAEGIKITFTAKDVKATDRIVVLHLTADGTWEVIRDAVAGDGTITGTFTSLSPVFYAVVEPEEQQTAEETNAGYSPEYYEQMKREQTAMNTAQETVMTSPKTSEDAMPYVWSVLAVACTIAAFAAHKYREM